MEDILGDDQPAGHEELRSIVARAGRRRWRTIAGSAAVALCTGGGIGYAVSNHSTPAQTVVAGSPPATNGSNTAGASPVTGGAPVGAPALFVNGTKLTPLFTRTSGDITIRAFLASQPSYSPMYASETCGLPMLQPRLQVEVSTPKMVGTSYGFSSASTSAVKSAQAAALGVPEGDPVTVVAIATSPSVANIRFVSSSGQGDQMDPVKGWAVLAVHAQNTKSTAVGSLFARSSRGATLEQTPVNEAFGPVPAVGGTVPPVPTTTGIYNGGAVSSSGSGTASSGSVSAGTGTARSAPNVACRMIPATGSSGEESGSK